MSRPDFLPSFSFTPFLGAESPSLHSHLLLCLTAFTGLNRVRPECWREARQPQWAQWPTPSWSPSLHNNKSEFQYDSVQPKVYICSQSGLTFHKYQVSVLLCLIQMWFPFSMRLFELSNIFFSFIFFFLVSVLPAWFPSNSGYWQFQFTLISSFPVAGSAARFFSNVLGLDWLSHWVLPAACRFSIHFQASVLEQ